jgi:predicted acetyltransferase
MTPTRRVLPEGRRRRVRCVDVLATSAVTSTDPAPRAAVEVRPPAGDAEVAAWFATEALGFGGSPSPAFVDQERTLLATERMLGVWEQSRCRATAGSYPFELTLPGGSTVGAAGVCDVTVAPDARRRGHLRALLARLHADARARGDVVAVLTASDGAIYGRFGYGVAASELRWRLPARDLRLRATPSWSEPSTTAEMPEVVTSQVVPSQAEASQAEALDGGGRDGGALGGGALDNGALDGEVVLGDAPCVDGTEVAVALDELWERTRRRRPGTLSRTPAWWRAVVGTHEGWKGGGTVFTHLARDAGGRVRGAVVYRLQAADDRGVLEWAAQPLDLVADSAEVEVYLWQVLAALDHVATIAPRSRPVDEPLQWRLEDPRRLRVQARNDQLWLCPLDVAGLLSARRYAAPTALVLAVEHPDREVAGTYRLEVAGGEVDGRPEATAPVLVGHCERVGPLDATVPGGVDLRLGADALGALSLGGVSAGVLAQAGRVHEERPGALAGADAALAVPLAPFNSTFF